MDKFLTNNNSIYEDFKEKIKILEKKTHYNFTLQKKGDNDPIVLKISHPNNIVILNNNFKINDCYIIIDLKNNNFRLSQDNNHSFDVNAQIMSHNKQIYTVYVEPFIHIPSEAITSNYNFLDIAKNNINKQYKLEHARKKVVQRETVNIRQIFHFILNDYVDKELRKLRLYYKVPWELCNKLYQDTAHPNFSLYKNRLFQALTAYPAMFRVIEPELGTRKELFKNICLGLSFKHLLGVNASELKRLRTPIIKCFDEIGLALIHQNKLKGKDLTLYYKYKSIMHPSYYKSRKDFLEFDNEFCEAFKINKSKKNYESKSSKSLLLLKDTTRFLRDYCGVDAELKLPKLIEISNRYHEVSHRLFISELEDASDSYNIALGEKAMTFNVSDFEHHNYIKQLVTRDDFIKEGKDLQHCVAGYHQVFLSKRSIIFGIEDSNNRSTIEFLIVDNKFKVNQHYTTRNTKPAAKNRSIAFALLKFLNEHKDIYMKQVHAAPYVRMVGGYKRSVNKELAVNYLLKPFKLVKKSKFANEEL
jgi:hypothetical protein